MPMTIDAETGRRRLVAVEVASTRVRATLTITGESGAVRGGPLPQSEPEPAVVGRRVPNTQEDDGAWQAKWCAGGERPPSDAHHMQAKMVLWALPAAQRVALATHESGANEAKSCSVMRSGGVVPVGAPRNQGAELTASNRAGALAVGCEIEPVATPPTQLLPQKGRPSNRPGPHGAKPNRKLAFCTTAARPEMKGEGT